MDTEQNVPKQGLLRGLTALMGRIVPAEPRRSYPRFVVPGATMTLDQNNARRSLNDKASEERLPVLELSRGGMSFLANIPFQINNKVTLSLILPESDTNISLIGRIVYCVPRGIGHDYRFRVGMQFAEFGVGKGYNSQESHQILKSLEESCKTLEPMDF